MTTAPQASLPAAGAWRARWRVDGKKAPPAAQGDASPTASAPAISSWCRLPRLAHGSDTDAMGNGVVQQHRLHQLVRLRTGSEHAHSFAIEFLDPGVQAYAFTFG